MTTLRPHAIIGSGVFSLVMRATRRDGTELAMKVLRPEWRDDRRVWWRLEVEAELLRRSASAHVLPVVDVTDDGGGCPALVTPLAAGGDLARYLGGRPTPIDDIARVARQLASAMATVGNAIGCHGDLHPANVLIGGFGSPDRPLGPGLRLWLTDPSLPRACPPQGQGWRERGTPPFRAPEQATDDPTIRSDIFGATRIVEALAFGHLPHLDERHPHEALLRLTACGSAPDPQDRPADPEAWLELVLETLDDTRRTAPCNMI